MDNRWFSVDEISEYMGVTRDTVYRWIDNLKLPAHKLGRLWKFRKEDIDEWVKSGKAGQEISENKGLKSNLKATQDSLKNFDLTETPIKGGEKGTIEFFQIRRGDFYSRLVD